MRAIIIGAGRGARLMPTTANAPKCFAEVQGKRMLDWMLHAIHEAGIAEVCFIGGYRIETVRQHYPHFEFRHNDRWESNNILASLFYAEDLMHEPFICTYSDILVAPNIIRDLAASNADIALGIDTAWRDRYEHRLEHPTDDAEKVIAENGSIHRIHREIHEDEAYGEYIGAAKFSAAGAARLRDAYRQCRERYEGQPFRETRTFEKAYLIHLLQEMIENGAHMTHVDSPGGYIEVDTQEDLNYAQQHWTTKHLNA